MGYITQLKSKMGLKHLSLQTCLYNKPSYGLGLDSLTHYRLLERKTLAFILLREAHPSLLLRSKR